MSIQEQITSYQRDYDEHNGNEASSTVNVSTRHLPDDGAHRSTSCATRFVDQLLSDHSRWTELVQRCYKLCT